MEQLPINHQKKPRNPKSGVALLLVMASVTFMAVIITEIIAASRVDLLIALNARNRLQAHYLAVSGAKLQLLRLHIYKEVKNLGNLPPGLNIDRIWGAPMPPFPLDKVKAKWPGELQGSIQSEGSKIPINLLDGNAHRFSSATHAEEIKKQITGLIEGLLETEEFDEKYRGLDPKDLINPLTDWLDDNSEKIGGGDEDREYDRLDPPYKNRNDRLPSLSELHLIQGWTDDLYNRLVPNFSTLNRYTTINPNYVPLSRIRTWAPDLTEEELALIDKRRRLQPFADMDALITFIQTDPDIKGGKNIEVPDEIKKNSSTTETIFMVEGTGIVGDTRRSVRMGVIAPIEADTYKKNPNDPDKYLIDPATGKPQVDKKGKLLMTPQVIFVEEFI